MFSLSSLRKDFPFFAAHPNITFLDNAASTQKPQIVINELSRIYSIEYANIHRGIYDLSNVATNSFEESRKSIAEFLNVPESRNIIFTKGATESINLVAFSYLANKLQQNDEILISAMEHHANFVPWYELCRRTGAKLVIVNLTKDLFLDREDFYHKLSNKTKFIAITEMSNVLGIYTNLEDIIKTANDRNIPILVDGCQSVIHKIVNLKEMNVDFFVFSMHKLYGPNGVGILYINPRIEKSMIPYQYGGEIVQKVSIDEVIYEDLPHKFEAGTPAIAEINSLSTLIKYLTSLPRLDIKKHEQDLYSYMISEMRKLENYTLYCPSLSEKNLENEYGDIAHSIISFRHNVAHSSDIGTILNKKNVAIRTGHHCAQPLMNYLNIDSTARASLGMYNSFDDIDRLIDGLRTVNKLF